MKRQLRYLLVLLLLCTMQGLAGVVEDAEEELRKMGRGQEQRVGTDSSRPTGSYPTRASILSQAQASGASSTKSSKNRSTTAGEGATEGSVSTVSASPDEVIEESGRAKLDKTQKRQGRVVSFGIVLLLALLIFLATVAGKRLGKTE